VSCRQRRDCCALPDTDPDADTSAVTERALPRLHRERREPVSVTDGAPVHEPIPGLLHRDRRQLAGAVPVAHRVVLTGTDAKRLSDRRRRPSHAVPDAVAAPIA